MSRAKPVLRAIKLLSLIERNPNGLRVKDMADQLRANPRAIYRDLQILETLPVQLYTDRNGKESVWKIDPDYRNRLAIPTVNLFSILHYSRSSRVSRTGIVGHAQVVKEQASVSVELADFLSDVFDTLGFDQADGKAA